MKTIEKIFNYFGYKKYNCTNCKKNSYLNGKDAYDTVVGYCRKCGHPIWYVILLLFMFTSCKTYNVYIVESPPKIKATHLPKPKENRFTSSFIAADSSFVNMDKLREASKAAVEFANKK